MEKLMSLFMDKEILLFNGATATGTPTSPFCAIDWQHVVLTLASSGSANFTIKVKGSTQDTPPDFSAAATVTNRWEHMQLKDLTDGSTVAGATGVSFAGADAVRMFEVNINRVKWISATITARSAGAITLAAI